jgi:hypothetical protein
MIHIAGRYLDGVQRCVRCGLILADYRNAAWPVGQEPPSGWTEGSHVVIEGHNPTFLAITVEPADCETIQ